MKLYVEQKTSKKTGNPYVALILDLGYRKAMLSYDYNLCAEVLKMSVAQMYEELRTCGTIEVDYEGR